MKKYKPRLVKFVFTPKRYYNSVDEPIVDIHFGNKYTDEINQYIYHRNHISLLFSDELKDDPRQYDKTVKFTENDATILLLKYLEDSLKESRSEKRRLDKLITTYYNSPKEIQFLHAGIQYAITNNEKTLKYNTLAVKKYRKIVKDILASPEYMWEQLNK